MSEGKVIQVKKTLAEKFNGYAGDKPVGFAEILCDRIDALEERISTLEKNEKINAEWYARHNKSLIKLLSNITERLGRG